MAGRRRVRADGVSVTTPPPFPVMLDPDLPPGFDPDARGDDDMPEPDRGITSVTINGRTYDTSTFQDGTVEDAPVYGSAPTPPPTVTFPEGMTMEEALAAITAMRDGSGRIGPATAGALGIPEPPSGPPSVRAVAVDAAARLAASTDTRSRTADGLARETVQAADILARYITTGETR